MPAFRRCGPSRLPAAGSGRPIALDARLGRIRQIADLARIVGQMVQLILAPGSKCRTSFHSGVRIIRIRATWPWCMSYWPKSVSSQGGGLAAQQRDEAPAPDFEVRRHAQPGHFQDRWEHVEVRDDPIDCRARRDHARPAHQERHADRVVEHVRPVAGLSLDEPGGVAFVPEPMLADHVTVIAGEDHDRAAG